MKQIILIILMFLLAACTAETAVEPMAESTAVPPTATVVTEVLAPTAVPTNPPKPTDEPAPPEPTPLPSAEPAPTVGTEVAEVDVVYGRTQEGAYFHGAVNAPVTLIDFSDFL
jgi:hypothetical protein